MQWHRWDKFLSVMCRVLWFCAVLLWLQLILKAFQGSQVEFTSPSECVYPRSPALGLGLTAAVALMVAQIIVNVATGCICCRKGPHQSNSNWTLALVCFVVSW